MKSKYIQYLNFPSVPEDLIIPAEIILDYPIYLLPGIKSFHFKTLDANDNLVTWLKDNIPIEFVHVRYQVIYNGITMHKDSTDRITVVNYLLDTGGDNVFTTVYDDDKNILQQECIEEKRWHSLSTNLYHAVGGNKFIRPRLAISIDTDKQPDYFSKFI